jgi:hypothetical protein
MQLPTHQSRFLKIRLPQWIAWVGFIIALSYSPSVFAQSNNTRPLTEVEDSEFGSGSRQPSRFGTFRLTKSPQGGAVIAKISAVSFDDQEPSDPDEPQQSVLNQDRVDSIHERIKLIQRLMKQERSASETAKLETGNPPQDSDPTLANKPEESPIEFFPLIEDRAGNSMASESNRDPETELAIPPPVRTGTPVTAKPIDPFELGNSLFLTGNATASRKSYESRLKQAQSPLEDAWLRCLIGCCYRLEGDLKSAETKFREVTKHKNNSYPVDYAKWSLQYIDGKQKSREQFMRIESDIEIMLKEMQKK